MYVRPRSVIYFRTSHRPFLSRWPKNPFGLSAMVGIHKVFSTILLPSRSKSSLIGSHIAFGCGAIIPGVLKAG